MDVAGDPKNGRRTIYGLVDRQSLPAIFRASISPARTSRPTRPRTNIIQQALFSMNAPFVVEQARALASRPEVAAEPTTEQRIAALYRASFWCRSPSMSEVQAGGGGSFAAPRLGVFDRAAAPNAIYIQLVPPRRSQLAFR